MRFKFTDAGHITLGCTIEKDKIMFYVEDTGIGLSEDKKKSSSNYSEKWRTIN